MGTYWDLWAKSRNDGAWHALPFHLLDVGAAAEGLWTRLPSGSRAVPIGALGDEGRARSTVAFLAAAHDIGKANRWFQGKAWSQKERLRQAGFPLAPDGLKEPWPHGQATGVFLQRWLASQWGWDGVTAGLLAKAVGGHHGKFIRDFKESRLDVGGAPWSDMGKALLDDLAHVFEAEACPEPECLNAFLGWLAGFVSVVDWLGSHDAMTVWKTEPQSFDAYLDEARARAEGLFESLGWALPPQTASLSITELIPADCTPNALQHAAANMAERFGLAIIEAPTGEGKTEAAFAMTEPMRSRGAGVYFALPTMATANGLHGRVEGYLKQATARPDLETLLLHSQSWYYRERHAGQGHYQGEGDGHDTQARDWFAGAKRGLLAPYAVGTIDQILIAALRARHGFVRLFALAGKTVVIDEVHAYDVYMGDLLDILLGWLRALECRVILLSATLPKARRDELLGAWGAQGTSVDAAYPCITWVDEAGDLSSQSFPVSPRKPLRISILEAGDMPEWQRGAIRILERVEGDGGVGALVLNTVQEAQDAYDWLRSQELDGIELDLFHARFTVHDRDRIERKVLERYGKEGARQGPAILVATQVVEQSLDLDFDHMVSALAPFDLLIQRAGRLHRHRRHEDGRLRADDLADVRPNPELEVIAPAGDVGEQRVYSPYVLELTRHYLSSGVEIRSPGDITAGIEAVYSETARTEATDAWTARLQEFEEKAYAEARAHERAAEVVAIGRVDKTFIVQTDLQLDEYNEVHGSSLAARTRLEDRPSISVVILKDCEEGDITIHGGDAHNARDAHLASLRITPPMSLWAELVWVAPLPAWQRQGALSRCRPLRLPSDARRFPRYEISYDETRGLVWRMIDAVVST